jgi:hypothetical protein
MGAPISLISMVRLLPSQCRAGADLQLSVALRERSPLPRSVMAQPLSIAVEGDVQGAEVLGSVGPRRRAQA